MALEDDADCKSGLAYNHHDILSKASIPPYQPPAYAVHHNPQSYLPPYPFAPQASFSDPQGWLKDPVQDLMNEHPTSIVPGTSPCQVYLLSQKFKGVYTPKYLWNTRCLSPAERPDLYVSFGGRPLNLVPLRLYVDYICIDYDPEFHEVSSQAEKRIQTVQRELWEENMQEWEDKGGRGEKPQRPALSTADPTAYHNARILYTFPNILSAIEQWQAKHPAEPPIIGDQSKEAYRGSAKMDYVLKTIKDIGCQKTTIPHPDAQRAANGETFSYQRKYIIASSLRLCRALLWCRIVQEVGEACVISVIDRADGNETING
ncbi:hypothetical protein COCC4DRAFT_58848 [Bipolaris maydis ATCC 48331]|uniref:Uncharacterized protein n=2 Tax=Cochliobolus heterostrophus TaxID=5016 RepID=M2UIL8_COCH5|nr:uncharacterized protein COCC4DRAFT_58848 [Bipolaris maydis ATCC 48331]EMD93526.1 hypothetical protein COCHEDRAFT_1212228 [Bipolaris maydis C5]KAJ5027840.1 hypothetical protein J3E73DRAFT_389781 [Bipolaris maydis]ENI07026.1 hypothetical protein COCC4DRAFT_58848 [Bipolaris maydis ATCC 48331]KAJ6204772.1 hypothetical protein PSV09DRAFT_1212228 [Bipolaris maydis]KAJ6266522.1 hypothetical protein PSV08DRAFT_374249 [Bipolaris maydis]